MRKKGEGSFFFSNNSSSLRGPQALYRLVVVLPAGDDAQLAQVLTENIRKLGVHVANVVIDGTIDSPGTARCRATPTGTDQIINPMKIAERSGTCTPGKCAGATKSS